MKTLRDVSAHLNWDDLHHMEREMLAGRLTTKHEYRCFGCEGSPSLHEARAYYDWLRAEYRDVQRAMAYAAANEDIETARGTLV